MDNRTERRSNSNVTGVRESLPWKRSLFFKSFKLQAQSGLRLIIDTSVYSTFKIRPFYLK